MGKQYFITGIGTGVGKTVVSAVLTEKLRADYWKPIQAGDLENSDSLLVASLVTNPLTRIHPEAYRLNTPASPHLAAALDGLEISIHNLELPKTANNLIVEGAGGLMVPLNNNTLILDLIKKLNIPVIVVSANYLGSINHTLLTIATLQQSGISLAGLVFAGVSNITSESYILSYTGVKCLGRIPLLEPVDKYNVALAGKEIDI